MYKPISKDIPLNPGVYLFKDKLNDIIYIGKAKSLRNRVKSYFSSVDSLSTKTRFLVRNICDVEFFIVDSEIEALLLENKLIKKHKPKYNINLKDSKTFSYIKITDEKIPKIQYTRRVTKKGFYYGPFANGEVRRELFFLVVKLFNIITKQTYSSRSQINYEIGLAPARKLKDVDVEEYLVAVDDAKGFLSGNKQSVINIKKKLKLEMKEASVEQKYEVAIEKKRQIEAIEYLSERQKVDLICEFDQDVVVLVEDEFLNKSLIQVLNIKKGVILSKKHYRFNYLDDDLLNEFIKMYYSTKSVPLQVIVSVAFWKSDDERELIEKYLENLFKGRVQLICPQRGEKLAIVRLALKNAELEFKDKDVLVELKNKLGLSKVPRIVECFDMSNLGSEFLVGGMTRFVDLIEDKDNYRKFEIKSFSGRNDDFASMSEVVYRRYKAILSGREKVDLPDLIVVDGGKGQVSASLKSLIELNVKIPIIGLVKRDEEIFMLGRRDALKFDKNSSMMLFLRKVRDLTHRFVISYNRKKRSRKFEEESGVN